MTASLFVDGIVLRLLHCGLRKVSESVFAYFFRNEMALGGYYCTPMLHAYQRLMAADNARRLLNQTRLRELKRAHGREIRLFCAHDAKELEDLSSTRFEPAPIIAPPL